MFKRFAKPVSFIVFFLVCSSGCLKAQPQALPASNVGNDTFTANWTSTGASTYLIDVSTSQLFTSFVYQNVGANGLSRTFTGLSPLTTYYYRVKAINTGYSNIVSLTTTQPPPPAPVAGAASNSTSISFTANWGLSNSATSYRLDVSTNSSFSSFLNGFNDFSVVSNNAIVTGLSPGTTYYYRVRAVNAFGVSSNSNTVVTVTIPPPPTATAANNIDLRSFVANWNPSNGADSYLLDVSTASNFSSFLAGYQNLPVSNSQQVTVPTANTTYYYRLRAVNSAGTSTYSNTVSVKTLTYGPSSVWATNVTTSSFVCNWSAVANASSYEVQVAADDTFSNIVFSQTNAVGQQTNVTNLLTATKYSFRVRAIISGSPTAFRISSVVTVPSTPEALPASQITAAGFTANWTGVAGATYYVLDVSEDNFVSFYSYNGVSYQNLVVSETAREVNGNLAGKTLMYRVRAFNGFYSEYSNVRSVVMPPKAPFARHATYVNPNSFQANWDDVSNAEYYLLQVSESYDFAPSSILQGFDGLAVTGNAAIVPGVQPKNKMYYYRIRAANVSGQSQFSNIVSVSADKNFVSSVDIMTSGVLNTSSIDGLTRSDKEQVTQFFDGIGRLSQVVTHAGSPNQQDVVQPIFYDALGRESFKFLPFVFGSNGWYKDNALSAGLDGPESFVYEGSEHHQFYQTGGPVSADSRPFSYVTFEPSPLTRPVVELGAGEVWASENKTVRSFYPINRHGTGIDQERVIAWRMSVSGELERFSPMEGVVEPGGFYASDQLLIRSIIDENNSEVREYTDKEGRVILKKVQAVENASLNNDDHWAQTYYIYDDFGNLVVVLPPEAVKALISQ